MMKDGLGFSLLPGNRPSTVTSASGLETLDWSFGRKRSGISQTLIAVRKSTLERYDFNRKDCFRAQTPLNCSDRQAAIGRDRRDSDNGMR